MNKEKNETTENQILDAAKKVFLLKGMDGARMQEIADEAGINKAMLHYYYRNKQLLFEAVFNHAFALIAPQLNQILSDSNSVEEKIKQFSLNHISFLIKHPYLPSFIIQELNRDAEFAKKMMNKNVFPNIGVFKNQIELAIENGELRPVKPEQLLINIIALNAFPFVARPLLQSIISLDDAPFETILEERKTEVANFIINAIKK